MTNVPKYVALSSGSGVQWRYSSTYPAWASVGVAKFDDLDVSSDDPGCYRFDRRPIDWQQVRREIGDAMSTLDKMWTGQLDPGGPEPVCGGASASTSWNDTVEQVGIDTRYSSYRNDCYFGTLAFTLSDHLCSMSVASPTHWSRHWHKLQLELENLLFYLEAPMSLLLKSQFRIPSVLRRLAHAVQLQAVGMSSRCDAADSAEDRELLQHADADTGILPPQEAEAFLSAHGHLHFSYYKGEGLNRCPFGLLAATLSLAIWLQVGIAKLDASGGAWASMDAGGLIDLYMLRLLKTWEERSGQFFLDTMISHWRIWELFDALGVEFEHRFPEKDTRGGATAQRQQRYRLTRALRAPVAHVSGMLRRVRVLFVGGSLTTTKWTSFTQRGRQLSRGLRALGGNFDIDARCWSAACTSWCKLPMDTSSWLPDVIVHVKSVCRCALGLWKHIVHLYDPVDMTHWRDALAAGRYLVALDGVLVTTSLAKWDLRSHPALEAVGNVSVDWLPIHHSNFWDVRSKDASEQPLGVGVHTVHKDERLRLSVKRVLASAPGSSARWVHLDPSLIFKETEGRVVTPQQTQRLYEQMAGLDIAVAKQSGCRSDWWFCSRWRTGQRLLNHLSVGIPTVAWADAQGHLDILRGLWPPWQEPEVTRRAATLYPPQLIPSSPWQVAMLAERGCHLVCHLPS
eukprot:TRINITY_DN46408_c0_g4_i2.p1 TRINITY_DN46408_c0_g4~~TRINITY_DN46408_c0_g4_i2.p1  ORF type:complete len:682 (+),score=89.05 TRINITY_DN46408_c0_g4_i2:78-2123(+)